MNGTPSSFARALLSEVVYSYCFPLILDSVVFFDEPEVIADDHFQPFVRLNAVAMVLIWRIVTFCGPM